MRGDNFNWNEGYEVLDVDILVCPDPARRGVEGINGTAVRLEVREGKYANDSFDVDVRQNAIVTKER